MREAELRVRGRVIPGMGQYNLTRWAGGKTVTVHLRPGPGPEKAEREVAEYQRFKALADQVAEVNEAICDARPPLIPSRAAAPDPEGPKKGLCEALAAEAAAGVAASLAGWEGIEAAERAIRAGLTRLGHGVLKDLLAADAGHRGPAVDCGAGHQAGLVSYLWDSGRPARTAPGRHCGAAPRSRAGGRAAQHPSGRCGMPGRPG